MTELAKPDIDLKQSFLQGVPWVFLSVTADRIIKIVTFVVLTRFVMPVEMGWLGIALIAPTLISIIMYSVLWQSMLAVGELSEQRVQHFYGLAFAMAASSGIILAGITGIYFWMGQKEIGALSLGLIPLGIFTPLIAVPRAILYRELQYKTRFFQFTSGSILTAILAFVFALFNGGIWSFVFLYVAQLIVENLTFLSLSSLPRPRPRWSIGEMKEMKPLLVSNLAHVILTNIQMKILVGITGVFLGAAAVGFVEMAQRFTVQLLQALQVMQQQLILPMFSRVQQDEERLRRFVQIVSLMSSILFFPYVILTLGLAEPLVRLLVGEQWIPAVPLVRTFALLGLYFPLLNPLTSYFLVRKRQRVNIVSKIIVLGSFVIFAAVGVGYGALGVVVAFVLASMIGLLQQMWIYESTEEVCVWDKRIVYNALISVVLIVFLWQSVPLLQEKWSPVFVVAVGTPLALVLYVLLLRLCVPSVYKQVVDYAKIALPLRKNQNKTPA